jgi:outer membrane lipoprotein SlyB
VWIGGGLLAMVTAALAGALVMRSVDPTPVSSSATVINAAAQPAMAAQPVPLTASVQAAPAVALAPAKPVYQSKPVYQGRAVPSQHVNTQARWNAMDHTTRTALCTICGVVESVSVVRRNGQGTGLGAVAGGVLGGVVGHQAGGGHGKTALTILGAIGGGLAGNEVEKRTRSETMYVVYVRMEDGSVRGFERVQPMAVGTRVTVEGATMHIARDTGGGYVSPRALRAVAPINGNG